MNTLSAHENLPTLMLRWPLARPITGSHTGVRADARYWAARAARRSGWHASCVAAALSAARQLRAVR